VLGICFRPAKKSGRMTNILHIGSKVLTAVAMDSSSFRDIMLCLYQSIWYFIPNRTLYILLLLWLYSPLLGPGRFYSSLSLYTLGRTPWMGDQPVTRLLPTHRTTQTQNNRTKPSMPQVGFESAIPVFEWRREFMPQSTRPP
jgi:hypothetical protein